MPLDAGLLDVAPVWLLSPETMAVLFPREPLFDLVIFDEASQCTVENGVPVLVRAKRSVIHVLDAKFRVVFRRGDESIDYKDDDIWKMHGYRDSIVGARSAWVLYPGTECEKFLRDGGTVLEGVGAVPLRPEPKGATELGELLASLLGPLVDR